jgi:hypothetical protein
MASGDHCPDVVVVEAFLQALSWSTMELAGYS